MMTRRCTPLLSLLALAGLWALMTTHVVTAFTTTTRPSMARLSVPTSLLLAKKKKGFGATETPKKKPKKQQQQPAVAEAPATTPVAAAPEKPQQLNAGQRALEKMRREQAEQKDAELRRVREMMREDQQVQETAAAIPEPVAQRMGKRMLPFVGIPLIGGMGAFVAFWYFATYKDMVFEPSQVAAATILILVFGLLGITYSVMSASWDPDREGGVLGVDEFKTNVENIQTGLKRSRENAMLREKMSGLSGDELQRALDDLDRKEQAEAKKKKTLENKLQEELD